MSTRGVTVFIACCAMLLCRPIAVRAAEGDEPAFLPTWKLLNNEEKRQFIAGYIYGWQDAHRVSSIAIDFIKENPKKAVASLESIKNLYDLSGLEPGRVVADLDDYFKDPEHARTSLSGAITALKARR